MTHWGEGAPFMGDSRESLPSTPIGGEGKLSRERRSGALLPTQAGAPAGVGPSGGIVGFFRILSPKAAAMSPIQPPAKNAIS